MNYLASINLTKTLPCLAEPGKIIVIGKPDRALDEVIPYLATLPGVIAYNPKTLTLTFRRQPGFMTLYPDKVYITQVRDSEEGLELLKALADAINATWEHRSELIAATSARHPRVGWISGRCYLKPIVSSAVRQHAWHSPLPCCNKNGH